MAPPKPSTPPTEDERRREPAAEADRLGREHSNKRDVRARAERLRNAGAEDFRPRSTGVPGVPGAPVMQPRSRSERPDRPERPERAESRVPDAEAPGGREGRTPAAPRPAERPPPRPERAERPERPERAPERAPEPARRLRVDEGRVDDGASSVIDDVAVEAEELLREAGTLWRRWTIADKITIMAALLTLFGTMLPWLRRSHEEVVLGVGCGGIVHAVIAIACIWLLVKRDRPALDERGLRPTPARQRQAARRTALWMLLLSLLSTVAGTWFLLVYGAVRRFEVPTLDIGVGLYVSLAAGLGLSYSGFAFFWRQSKTDDR